MAQPLPHGLSTGLPLGFVIAGSIAIGLRYLPEPWLLDQGPRMVLYALQVPAGLIFVAIARAVARLTKAPAREILLWATCGAMSFDGVMLGFWPDFYGHVGEARSVLTAILLWAFAWILAAGLATMPREPERQRR